MRHQRADTTLQSYDRTGDGLERHASHQVAGFFAQFAS
jgi:integrase/recombinase XerC/integrase/recombinase XerD